MEYQLLNSQIQHERNMAAESLKEGETCSIVLPSTKNDPKVIELDSVLKDWVNETLASERIIVKDLRDDLYDGKGLSKHCSGHIGGGVPHYTPSFLMTKYKCNTWFWLRPH